MTNNKQQTAVEWLIDELEKYEKGTSEYFSIPAIQNHARRMENQQNKNYLKEYFEWHKSMKFVSHKPEDIIEFNETYGGDK
jgi:hypothetical protein